MNYKHLSIEERSCIRKYYVDGLSYRRLPEWLVEVQVPSREKSGAIVRTCMISRPIIRTLHKRSICCADPTVIEGCIGTKK